MSSQGQAALLDVLCAIFPEFRASWHAQTADDPYAGHSLHAVYLSFLPYFSRTPCTSRQLSQLGALVSDEVGKGGESENAAVTCFLEHLSQVGLASVLKPWLSAEARLGLRA